MTIKLFAFAGTVLVLATSTLAAAEKKIQAKDLPAAVQKAIPDATRGATIKGYAREVEGGKTMFEVETMVNGHSRDLLFDASGALVEIEEAVRLDAVPAAVRTALESRGRVLNVEQVTRGKTVSYEATVQKNGKKSEVAVDADGTLLTSP
jgi:uncharacterized cupredoxin-like copper-binding protein